MKKLHMKISTKVVLIVVFFSALMVVTVGAVTRLIYAEDLQLRFGDQGHYYAQIAAARIDGDRILDYYETRKTDAYYVEVSEYLDLLVENSDVEYIYVYVPLEDETVYIWDTGDCELGDSESYSIGEKSLAMQALSGEEVDGTSFEADGKYEDLVTILDPIYDSNGDAVALIGVDYTTAEIRLNTLVFTIILIFILGVIVALLCIFLFFLIRNSLIRPIAILDKNTKKMVENISTRQEIDIPIKTHDELEELADSFKMMYHEVGAYIDELTEVTAEKERIGAELDVAKDIQESMLPRIFPAFPDRDDIEIYAIMKPAKEVGGDFYDFFLIDDTHLAVVMADVSGKGVPAALFMMISKTLIKIHASQYTHPSEILATVNNRLCENNQADMFVTAWLGILDLKTGRMEASNAGHEYPAFKKAGGSFELIEDQHGFVLAGLENSKYTDYEIMFAPGDTLFVYTDGVAEATDVNEELFGTQRMLQALNKETNASCEQYLDQVMDDIRDFVGEAPQFDDITMLCFIYHGV